ncbi:MAG: beta-ketoacyl-[acyl-carrier-protein] synthase II, partial [Gammaproteobacteria bacterium]|nr:beta-ketoacyl-[acyl-carrier-protein] synthase II [Gammaproteobacteria bacterium]
MTKPRSVVITGLGCISSLGHNTTHFWDAIKSGRSEIGPSKYNFRAELNGAPIAEVHDYEPEDYFSSKSLKLLDRATQFALIASKEALQSAGLETPLTHPGRTGIILGS